jgi:hypothetical protein
LNHLENCLGDLIGKKGLEKLVQNLKNANEFWSYLSEVEAAANLKEVGEIEIEPRFPDAKSPDLRVKIEEKWVYFEIVTPRLLKVLEEAKGKVISILNNEIII